MFTTVVLPIIILSALGLIAGLLLALAAKFMAVKSDLIRLEKRFQEPTVVPAVIPAAMIMPRHWRPQRGSKRIFVFLVVKILPGLSVKSLGWNFPM